jgi:hypothetical protein
LEGAACGCRPNERGRAERDRDWHRRDQVRQSPLSRRRARKGRYTAAVGSPGGCRLRGRSRPVEVVRDVIACKLLAGRRSNGRR